MLASTTAVSPWLLAKGVRRVVLVDGTQLRCLGKQAESWRIHTGYDLIAGRLREVEVTDTHSGEDWRRFWLEPGDVVISDEGLRLSRAYRVSTSPGRGCRRALFAQHVALF